MKSTRRRRELILALITTGSYETQEELVEALRAKGVDASQASISRDISLLGLVKVAGRYEPPPPMRPVENPLEERVAASLVGLEMAGENLLVLRTPPGEASATALAVDRLDLTGIVGTIAGDDTIFTAVRDRAAGMEVARSLKAIMRSGG
ncbi:MAG: arginine repressor [bacterium]|nr:arginine repressor [bacterium]